MPLPLLGEKALGSGGKSEDQPSIGKMPNTLDVRVVLAIRIYFFELQKTQRCFMRAYVYYYISSQGAVCREDNASPFFKIINFLMLYHYVIYYRRSHRIYYCNCRCITTYSFLQPQGIKNIVFLSRIFVASRKSCIFATN